MAVAAIAGAAASAIGGLFQGFGARKAARRAARRARKLQRDLNRLEANRQEIIDPSRNIVDRSGLIQNNFGNLQVATQAPHPIQVAASKALSAFSLFTGIAFASCVLPEVFTEMNPPAC